MKRQVAVVALLVATVGGAFYLLADTRSSPLDLSMDGSTQSSGQAVRFPTPFSNEVTVPPNEPEQKQSAKKSTESAPRLEIPGGQDTFHPTEAQRLAFAKKMSQSGASDKDVQMAQQTAAYIQYADRISAVLSKPGAEVSADEYEQLLSQTGQMASDRYLTLSEAHQVKARLLSTQYSGAKLQEKLVELNQETTATQERLLAAGDPSQRPEAVALRAQEAQIWKEANSMTSFPNKMTKEEYVLSRLKR